MGELVAVTVETPMKVVVPAAPTTTATSLAPGFRFHPTDEELVTYYLRRKACGKPFRFEAVTEIDVYKSEPWELAAFASLKTRDLEWYFFSPIDRKYGNGSRLNRATGQGYWKATGKDRPVHHKFQIIGMKKTLVFHTGRAPDGKRTNWVMHEYRLADGELGNAGVSQGAFVLCRIFQKSGLGPPSGDRFAPFIDVEWDNGAPLLVPGAEAEEEMDNGIETRVGGGDLGQDTRYEHPTESHNFAIICKRERSEELELEPLSLSLSKRSKPDEPSSSYANGSENSTTTSKDPPPEIMTTTNFSSALVELPLLKPPKPKESQPANPFDSSELEKSMPPGYLKFISNLENEILNVSMERENLKIEMMRAQAMINVLQSRIEMLNKENDDLKKRCVHGV